MSKLQSEKDRSIDINFELTRVSKPIPTSSTSSSVSLCSKFIATAVSSRVTVRDIYSFEVLHSFTCIDKIERIEFSPDSCYILCAQYSRCTVQAFSLIDSAWTCRINENIAGLTVAKWAPDSRHIITVSDFGIQLAIWSLTDSCIYLVSSPKPGHSMSLFSDNGSYLAVALRLDCKDHIGVYAGNTDTVGAAWGEISKFKVRSNDLAAIQWSPNGTHLLVNDTPLSYRLLVYTPSGEEIACFEEYSNALGIRSSLFCPTLGVDVQLSPRARFLAVSSYDGVIRLLSTVCWAIVFALPMVHPKDMRIGFGGESDVAGSPVVTTVEVEAADVAKCGSQSSSTIASTTASLALRTFVHRNLKVLPRTMTVNTSKPLSGQRSPPLTGLGWSACGTYLSTLDPEGCPRCIWIWEAGQGLLRALLVLLDPVLCMSWRPRMLPAQTDEDGVAIDDMTKHVEPVLAYCTGSNRVYLWSPVSGPTHVDVTAPWNQEDPLTLSGLQWSRNGSHLLLTGKCGDQSYCTVMSSDQHVAEILRRREEIRAKELPVPAIGEAVGVVEAPTVEGAGAENIPPPPPPTAQPELKGTSAPKKASKVSVAKPASRKSSASTAGSSNKTGKIVSRLDK